MNYNIFFVVLPCLFAYCLCEITQETQLSDLNNDYNVQPSQEKSTSDGYQPSTEEIVTPGVQVLPLVQDASTPCVGCSSHVSPQAEGVNELANLGVRHLDFHNPTVKHRLESVIDVERQVQVVNGVRYILTLSINFDNCTEGETDTDVCASNEICKISILAKPWQTLPSGAKYRSILANNCTDEWLFGDEGEVLPELTDRKEKDDNTSDDDVVKERVEDSESLPNQEKPLTVEQIKAIEEQIVPYDHFKHYFGRTENVETSSPDDGAAISKDHINTISSQRRNDNNIPESESKNQEASSLSQDKKKAIDAMFDFFNFPSVNASPQQQQIEEIIPRVNQ